MATDVKTEPGLAELQRLADEGAGNYGRGLAEWERGQISSHELGVLKRRANKARQNLYTAHLEALG